MEKIIAFIYNYHRKDERTKDIALLQTFVNISTFLMFILIPLFDMIGLQKTLDLFKNLSKNNKYLEYSLGIIFLLLLYYFFSKIYNAKRIESAYSKYKYPKNYLLFLRIMYIINLLIFILIIFVR